MCQLTPRSKWKMHPSLFQKFPKSECPDIWTRLPIHKWPKSWSSKEDPVVPLERNLYGHLVAGLLWERQFEKVLLEHGLGKSSKFGNENKDQSCLCHLDDIELAGKKQNLDPIVENTHERR